MDSNHPTVSPLEGAVAFRPLHSPQPQKGLQPRALRLKHSHKAMILALAAFGLSCTLATAQAPGTLPLPPNYQTTFENKDVLVMKVHYGAHEFVPMHDHSAYPTVYLYLNASGEVQLKHEGADGFIATRPPTQTGAWRISPGMAERHSVQSQSDTPSDFLRIELKRIPADDIKAVTRGPASTEPGSHSEFQDAAMKIDRVVCPPDAACELPSAGTRSLLVAINIVHLKLGARDFTLNPGDTLWLVKDPTSAVQLSSGAQTLRVSLLGSE